ncbi:MAG: hypothetical protein LBQ06_06515 [Frankiaceae bacterium]|jgi:hypothetical protein|nr:hypothetical protein [Frankiaceae bacterium]
MSNNSTRRQNDIKRRIPEPARRAVTEIQKRSTFPKKPARGHLVNPNATAALRMFYQANKSQGRFETMPADGFRGCVGTIQGRRCHV